MTDRGARALVVLGLALLVAGVGFGCSNDESGDTTLDAAVGDSGGEGVQDRRVRAADGTSRVAIVAPGDSSPGLELAIDDLADAIEEIASTTDPVARIATPSESDAALIVEIDPAATVDGLDSQGYRLSLRTADGRPGLRVEAQSPTGAMYGVYHVLADMGARYHHPEETFLPTDNALELPAHYEETQLHEPAFELRGFHEHTQHPIVMSDYYLRPDDGFRDGVSRYLQWLARNRQNAASWHMLKSVDVDAWLPYVTDIIDEAHGYGVRVGMVLSYVDQQQNNFRIIIEERGEDDEQQIRDTLTRLAGAGFDFFAVQIGSSEFTKPDDEDVLRWLEVSADVLEEIDGPELFTWIHTTCDLEAEDGTRFFHLPGRADPRVGTWVHTTMFYDLERPAPVYGCESFQGQLDFLAGEDGERRQVYFPETAWWLGFDNNVPIPLPVTGLTRGHDIVDVLPPFDVAGHITFTSGREWTYWQYDHYLTRATWTGTTEWSGYLDWLAPVYGANGEAAATALDAFAELQARHFLEERPLIYFYIAGELRQDEIGAQAGILARRPKIAFAEVLGYDDAAFDVWMRDDLDYLVTMRGEYAAVVDAMPLSSEESGLTAELYRELWTSLSIFVQRIEHAIELYSGVADARRWRVERDTAESPSEALRAEALADAETHLASARAITADVLDQITAREAHYRYPLDLLARAKPESLTAYPFGYLFETSTAHFWDRRDDQLEALIDKTFDESSDAWSEEPDLVAVTDGDRATLTQPDDPIAGGVLTGFVPQVLFGLYGIVGEQAPGSVTLALDFNENALPDDGTETPFEGDVEGDRWSGAAERLILPVQNDAGELFAELPIETPTIWVDVARAGEAISGVTAAELRGQVESAELIAVIRVVGGIDVEGVTNLLKTVFGIPADEPLPEFLEVAFEFAF